MSPIQIRSKLDLLNTWAIDRTRFSPDASRPPACLRCGRPLDPVLGHNALSRYADVYICAGCGADEAIRDMEGRPIPLDRWEAAKDGRLKPPSYEDFQLLSSRCGFPEIYQGTSVDPYGHKAPRCELVYSRSYYDGYRWHTTWFPCWEDRRTPALAREVDQFMDALLEAEEFRSLGQLRRMCRACAEPTSDPTEFNLYGEMDSFRIWIRAITREKDYNLYIHFYLKDSV